MRTVFTFSCLMLVACSDSSSTSIGGSDGSLDASDMTCGASNLCDGTDGATDQDVDSALRDSDLVDAQMVDGETPDVEMPNPVDASSEFDSEIEPDAALNMDSTVAQDSSVSDAELMDANGSDAQPVDSALDDIDVASPDAEMPIVDSAMSDVDATLELDAEVDGGQGGDVGAVFPEACLNGQQDADEEDVDCGGPCPPCLTFVSCEQSDECNGQVCYQHRCVPNYCDDGIQNFDEVDVDCGGGCGQCDDQGCLDDVDCASGRCVDAQCEQPVCGNGVVDAGEECDDGNAYRFDGCLPDCVLASSQLCIGTCSSQGTRLTPSGSFLSRVLAENGVGGEAFGLALAKSNDQVFVGAPYSSPSGTVSVFTRSADTLNFVESLRPRDVVEPQQFGANLASDRDTLLVGAPGANSTGLVYVFRRRGGEQWVQTQVLAPDVSQPGLLFGQGGLAVHGDIAVVGVPRESSSGMEAGAAYVFRRGGDNRFSFVEKLVAGDASAYQNFGESVATQDGVILVGAPALQAGPNGYARFKGAAYVFDYNGTGWSERQKLVATGGPSLNGYNFGTAVELTDSGLLVSAPREDFTAAQSGVVYLYRRSVTGDLILDQKVGLPEPSPGSLLGMSLHGYQDLILVGQPFRMSTDGLNNAGGVAVFQRLESGRYRYAGVWENAFASRNSFYGAKTLIMGDVAVISTHGDSEVGVGSGAVTLVKLRSPLCDLQGDCICEEGAEGPECSELSLCGDGIVQPSEQCDVGIFAQACEPGCILPNCSDGVQNGNETDIDCGGACGSTCASGEVCVTDFDCLSRACGLNRLCQEPSCNDGIQNGDEPDVDCGEICQESCGLGQFCYDNIDCESRICGADGLCKPMNRIDGPAGVVAQDFGASISLDGDRLLVGAPANDQVGTDVGAAYIYERNESGVWTLDTVLIPSDTNNNMRFGESVALQGDVAVIGAPGTSPLSDFNTGSAYVYRKGEFGWSMSQQLVTNDGPNSNGFGSDVAIDDDFLVIGTPQGLGGARGQLQNAGSAHVFSLNEDGLYDNEVKLYDVQGSSGSQYGNAVALDGSNLVVGASGDNFNRGVVLNYRLVTSADGLQTWELNRRLELVNQDVAGNFGSAIALHGNHLAVSAPKTGDAELTSGSVHLFTYHASGNWLQQGTLTTPPGPYSGIFGEALGVFEDTLFISQVNDAEGSFGGSVHRYVMQPSGEWSFQRSFGSPSGAGSLQFGQDLSTDSERLIVSDPGTDSGSVYFFDRNDP